MKNSLLKNATYICLLIFLNSCNNNNTIEDNITISIVNNQEVTFTSMEISATMTYEGESEIIERGIVWSSTFNPTLNDNKITASTNSFTSTITDLNVDKIYYFKAFITNGNGTTYSEEKTFKTLSFGGTSWEVATVFNGDFTLYAQVDFHEDTTTKYDELNLPLQCPGCFITYGSWSIDGKVITYIWKGTDIDLNSAIYVYTGTISGMNIQGTYKHVSAPEMSWSATIL